MGASVSTTKSVQEAEAFLSQQYSGSCDIKCHNIMSDINLDFINSTVMGDINLTQSCKVNANCMISSASDAVSDIMFKATNSSNARFALANINIANASSRQSIKQSIIQDTSQTCEMSSLNQMNDINILAANSTIGGSVNLSQDGDVQGTCQLSNTFTAAATATAIATNTAKSGKDKKDQKKGNSSALITIGAVIVLVVIIFVVGRMFTGSQYQSAISEIHQKAAFAKGEAGCPGGKLPILDKISGKPIIDPRTMGPICPPGEAFPTIPAPAVVNVYK